ncbi:MAG: hypothetical protein CM1200mP3_14990 [Chloroflexota bacterium]|nr:MAG: hypothetical protein CM1200mP3_14990 [Chloroflexota bacterium]
MDLPGSIIKTGGSMFKSEHLFFNIEVITSAYAETGVEGFPCVTNSEKPPPGLNSRKNFFLLAQIGENNRIRVNSC